MERCVLYLKPENRDFLKEDSEKNNYNQSQYVNSLIEMSRDFGGYRPLLLHLESYKQSLQQVNSPQQPSQSPSNTSASTTPPRKVGRPRKPGIVKIAPLNGTSKFMLIMNKRTGKNLIALAPDFIPAAQYVRKALQEGTFERKDVQSDFTDSCDSFLIQQTAGDTVRQVHEIYSDLDFYDSWIDLSSIGNIPDYMDMEEIEDEKPKKRTRKKRPSLKTFMSIRWDEVKPDMVHEFFKNVADVPEVHDAVVAYIERAKVTHELPDFLIPDKPEDLEAHKLLAVLQQLQEDLRAEGKYK